MNSTTKTYVPLELSIQIGRAMLITSRKFDFYADKKFQGILVTLEELVESRFLDNEEKSKKLSELLNEIIIPYVDDLVQVNPELYGAYGMMIESLVEDSKTINYSTNL